MLALIMSRFDKGDHVKWRSFGLRESGTGTVVKSKLEIDSSQQLYYFKHLIESDENEERRWLPERELDWNKENKENE